MSSTFIERRPGGDDPIEDTVNEFLANEDVEGLAAWLEVNYATLTPDQQDLVRDAVIAGQGAGLLDMSPVEDVIGDFPQTPGQVMVETAEEVTTAVEQTESYKSFVDRTTNSLVADYDAQGTITFRPEQLEQFALEAGLSPADAANAAREAMGNAEAEIQGRDPAELEEGQRAPPEEGRAIEPITQPTPDWLLELNLAAGARTGELSPEQQDRMVDYWNTYHIGPNQDPFASFQELVPSLGDGTNAHVRALAEAALTATEPTAAFNVPLLNGRSMMVDEQTAQNLFENFGFDLPALQRTARLMQVFGDDILPHENEQDALLLTATLAFASGLIPDLAAAEALKEGAEAREEREQALLERARPATVRQADLLASMRARIEAGPETVRQADLADREFSSVNVSMQGLLRLQQEGMERYGDVGMAYIHALDEGLAARVSATGGDPDKLSFADTLQLEDYLRKSEGRTGAGTIFEFGNGSPLDVFSTFAAARRRGGGGAGAIRRVIDPIQARQQFSELYEAILLGSPSEELLNQLTVDLQKDLDEADAGQNFDVSARILDFIRGTTRYHELYRNRPAGLSEDQYLGQFIAAGQSLLGTEAADPAALEAGLRTGEVQTTVGSIAAAQQAAPEEARNSRFWGRLAEAANVFKANT